MPHKKTTSITNEFSVWDRILKVQGQKVDHGKEERFSTVIANPMVYPRRSNPLLAQEPPWAQLGQGCAAELYFPEHTGTDPGEGLHAYSSPWAYGKSSHWGAPALEMREFTLQHHRVIQPLWSLLLSAPVSPLWLSEWEQPLIRAAAGQENWQWLLRSWESWAALLRRNRQTGHKLHPQLAKQRCRQRALLVL